MSVKQYMRKASLIVGLDSGNALDLSALRFAFAVRRGDLQTPNSADIRVYNVNDDTAQQVAKEFTRIVIQAGYDGNYGVIFDGEIKQVRRGRESQTDTYLDITAADGDSAYNFAVSALSLAAGSTPNDHVSAVLQGMAVNGITRGYVPDLPGNPSARGKVFYGMSRDEMRKIARNTGAAWSIQDGKFVMVPLNNYMPGDVPVITAATGMVGLPEQTQSGIKIKTLLNPNLKIGQAVKLDNESIQRYRYGLGVNNLVDNQWVNVSAKTNDDGLYYVMVANHSGDTRGNDWYTDLICLAIDATVPKDYAKQQGVSSYLGPVKPYG